MHPSGLKTFPSWLRKTIPPPGKTSQVKQWLDHYNIHTVCREARCPNQAECYSCGTATFLLLGDTCTRNCAFCSVKHGTPAPLDSDEPRRIVDAARRLGLSFVVLTCVTRDDLDDGGASQIAQTIRLLKDSIPGVKVEILVSDLQGNWSAARMVLESNPDVFNHNIETVMSLYPTIRPAARYHRSLEFLTFAAANSRIPIKSGLMVGLGESPREVGELMVDLYRSGVRILTIGQYLQPKEDRFPVQEYITPEQFSRYEKEAYDSGFTHVFAGPFVRSSYRAAQTVAKTTKTAAMNE